MLSSDETGKGALRLQREAMVAGRLSHPNIARVLDFGQWQDGSPYMVMEYVDGKNLGEFIHEHKNLSCFAALPIFIQIANGLAFAHKNKIVHRDLKPSNVILKSELDDKFQVKVLDFGVACIIDQKLDLTQKGSVVGSPLYLSPEQANGEDATFLSDIYSFGCLMFEVLTGVPPFRGASTIETLYMHKNVAPPLVTDLIPVQAVPRELVELVDMCLCKGPFNRPPDFETIASRLCEIQQKSEANSLIQEKLVLVPELPKSRFGQILKSKAGISSLALIVVAILGLGVSILQTQKQKISKTW